MGKQVSPRRSGRPRTRKRESFGFHILERRGIYLKKCRLGKVSRPFTPTSEGLDLEEFPVFFLTELGGDFISIKSQSDRESSGATKGQRAVTKCCLSETLLHRFPQRAETRVSRYRVSFNKTRSDILSKGGPIVSRAVVFFPKERERERENRSHTHTHTHTHSLSLSRHVAFAKRKARAGDACAAEEGCSDLQVATGGAGLQVGDSQSESSEDEHKHKKKRVTVAARRAGAEFFHHLRGRAASHFETVDNLFT